MMRFADDTFKGSFMSTVGIDFVRFLFSPSPFPAQMHALLTESNFFAFDAQQKMKTIQIDGKRVKIQIVRLKTVFQNSERDRWL